MKFRINLSYNPLDGNKIAQTIARYDGRHHSEIIQDFENQLRATTGSRYVVALNSGTAAIHLALKALGVERGDYVLVSTFTYVASVNPIMYQGAIPFFIDSETDTWNMDPVLLEEGINTLLRQGKKPKAIVLVHSYGVPAKMNELMAVANYYGIPIVEDAAEAIGSYYNNKHVGTFGEIGTLSFNTNKILTTFGGGAILTESKAHYDKILFWATQACEPKPYYEHKKVGFNYRMGPLNAAVGLCELSELDQKLQDRKAVFENYKIALQSTAGFRFIQPNPGIQCNYWFSTLLVDPEHSKNRLNNMQLMKFLAKHEIETRLTWNPMHGQPVFQQYSGVINGVSDRLFAQGLCLPSDHQALFHQKQIIETIQEA